MEWGKPRVGTAARGQPPSCCRREEKGPLEGRERDWSGVSISRAVPWGMGLVSIPHLQPEPFPGDLLRGHGFFWVGMGGKMGISRLEECPGAWELRDAFPG